MSKEILNSLLQKSNVRIKNSDLFLEKLENIAKDGKDKLQVISDFDMTITKHRHLNKRVPSCHNILESHHLIPENVQEDLKKLKDKYYAIEIDHNLTKEEKIPHMIDWWTTAHNILVRSEIKKENLAQAVEGSLAKLREGVKDFFDILYFYQIPLLIFSAGVGDVLEEVIRQQATLHPNIKTVSNFMQFDDSGKLVGFQNTLIHTFNKNEGALEGSDYFTAVSSRNNCLLLGDMEADGGMADGVKDLKTCLKIGFLNDNVDKRLIKFEETFDIVLLEDETLQVPDVILKHVLGMESN